MRLLQNIMIKWHRLLCKHPCIITHKVEKDGQLISAHICTKCDKVISQCSLEDYLK